MGIPRGSIPKECQSLRDVDLGKSRLYNYSLGGLLLDQQNHIKDVFIIMKNIIWKFSFNFLRFCSSKDNKRGDVCEYDYDDDAYDTRLDTCPLNHNIWKTDFRNYKTISLNKPNETDYSNWEIRDEVSIKLSKLFFYSV